jgi:23S rRNA (guanosine2251-2'-O)-methyltransferase
MTQIIYGVHPVKEALKSPHLQFQKILIGTQKQNPPIRSILDLAIKRQIPVTFTTKEMLNKMVKDSLHQNVVGLIKETQYVDLGEILSKWKKKGAKALLLILDGIQDPQNLGSLIRTALGCGADGMIIPKDRAVGITPSVVKASAGAALHLPITRVVNIAATIDALKKEGIWVYGASGESKDLIYNFDLNIDLAIVIGAEGKGIRPLVKKKCDGLFSIPMEGPISSFNASVSAGMALYELMRQRFLAAEGPSYAKASEGKEEE